MHATISQKLQRAVIKHQFNGDEAEKKGAEVVFCCLWEL
jgi:hypothetical protein